MGGRSTVYDPEREDEIYLSDLLGQGRLPEAIELLGAAIDAAPDDPVLHSLLALCFEDTGRSKEALDAAKEGVSLGPSEPFALWVLGTLLADRRQYKPALDLATQAIELAPDVPDNEALMAQCLAGLKRWEEALTHAERGLVLDPNDEVCRNLRALALRHTDGADAAAEELERLASQYAPSQWLREVQGWTALERGSSLEAQVHFEQALELNPASEFARVGLAEAVKSENPVYRRILQFFMWMDRLPARTRWFIILGGIFAYRRLSDLVEAQPSLAVVVYPLMVAWLGFILLSWTSEPLSNFVLSRTVRGKPLVKGEKLLAAKLITGLLASALILALLSAGSGMRVLGAAAFVAGFQVIPTSAVFQCLRGWPQNTMTVYASLTALAGLIGIFVPGEVGNVAFGVFLVMAVLGSWIGAFLASRKPAR